MDVQLHHVGKIVGHGQSRQQVLDDVHFTVQSGAFVAIVGRSGCGKSTLLRLIAGLERPTSGVVRVGGVEVRGPGPDRGMVFQKYSLYPWLTVAQNVGFGMALRGLTTAEIRERTSYFLDVVGLAETARKLPRELSGGMQQRIAIARALAADPQVLLLDEPFGALDLQIRESMQEFLYRLWERNRITAVLVTHDLEEALLLAQTVHVLAADPGRLAGTMRPDFNHGDLATLRLNRTFLQWRQRLADRLRAVNRHETPGPVF